MRTTPYSLATPVVVNTNQLESGGVIDDGHGTVIIKLHAQSQHLTDEVIAEILFKKKVWMDQNRTMRIRCLTFMTGGTGFGSGGNAGYEGAALTYEQPVVR